MMTKLRVAGRIRKQTPTSPIRKGKILGGRQGNFRLLRKDKDGPSKPPREFDGSKLVGVRNRVRPR